MSAKGRPKREHRSAQREGPTTSAPGALVTPAYCQLMARYNRWMNERLYALCAEVDDAERRRDRGAFFGSIHGTLNRLLWGDRTWLGRFTGEPCTASAAEAMVYRMNPRSAEANLVRFVRTCATSVGLAPNHLAGVAPY